MPETPAAPEQRPQPPAKRRGGRQKKSAGADKPSARKAAAPESSTRPAPETKPAFEPASVTAPQAAGTAAEPTPPPSAEPEGAPAPLPVPSPAADEASAAPAEPATLIGPANDDRIEDITPVRRAAVVDIPLDDDFPAVFATDLPDHKGSDRDPLHDWKPVSPSLSADSPAADPPAADPPADSPAADPPAAEPPAAPSERAPAPAAADVPTADSAAPRGKPRSRRDHPSVAAALTVGFATWLVCGLLLFGGVKAVWNIAVASRDDIIEQQQNAVPEQPQPEAPSAERVAQLFTGQKVDYRTLAEGDMLYAGAVASLVTVDFPDFTDVNTVPADRILAYGVWESLKNPDFAGGAVASEERIYVDAASVEAVARQELGFHGRLEHQTVGDFRFDVITSRYSAASHGVNVMGYAEVVSCEIEGDEATLTVRCYEEDSQNELIEETGTRRIQIDISGEIARIRSLTTLQPPASH